MEFKLQRFIVREPEQSLGVFAGTWWDLTDEQREAAETLGYSGNEDDVRAHPYQLFTLASRSSCCPQS